jgi:hypothetical protein
MSDLFAAQSAIVTRLADQVSTATAYYGSQIVGANSQTASLPALIVAPGQAEVPDRLHSDEGGAIGEDHRWRIGIRVAMNTGAAATARAEPLIGALAGSVIAALKAWTPGSKHSVMRYYGHEELQYAVESGYAELWLTFGTITIIS